MKGDPPPTRDWIIWTVLAPGAVILLAAAIGMIAGLVQC
jgi:hypothetical protein